MTQRHHFSSCTTIPDRTLFGFVVAHVIIQVQERRRRRRPFLQQPPGLFGRLCRLSHLSRFCRNAARQADRMDKYNVEEQCAATMRPARSVWRPGWFARPAKPWRIGQIVRGTRLDGWLGNWRQIRSQRGTNLDGFAVVSILYDGCRPAPSWKG